MKYDGKDSADTSCKEFLEIPVRTKHDLSGTPAHATSEERCEFFPLPMGGYTAQTLRTAPSAAEQTGPPQTTKNSLAFLARCVVRSSQKYGMLQGSNPHMSIAFTTVCSEHEYAEEPVEIGLEESGYEKGYKKRLG